MRHDVYLHLDVNVDGPDLSIFAKKLDQILALVLNVKHQGDKMSAELDALTVQVTQNTDLESSAITLIKGLAQQISDLKGDPAALQALADKLNASATSLAQAITDNTPA